MDTLPRAGLAQALREAEVAGATLDQHVTAPTNSDLARDRTDLRKFRTLLALDRTTLAWIRTTLTMATFGFGTVGLFRSLRASSPTPKAVHLHERHPVRHVPRRVGPGGHGGGGDLPLVRAAEAPSRRGRGADAVAPQHRLGVAAVRRRLGGALGRLLAVKGTIMPVTTRSAGVQKAGAAGILLGRLSSVSLRGQLEWWWNTFSNDGVKANGAVWSLGVQVQGIRGSQDSQGAP
jgi:hypothetical protein